MEKYHKISDLLPHDPPMVLLDRYISSSDAELVAETDITPSSQFYCDGLGVPAYIGIEYIAQAVSAFNGVADHQQGRAVRPGFLLGSRKVQVFADYFTPGALVVTHVEMSFNDGEMAVFEGQVLQDGQLKVKARINAYQPENPAAFIEAAKAQI